MVTHQNVGSWPMIPSQAFLFFPTGNQIKQGQAEKQWRKIFQDDSPYDDFENKNIDDLQKKLKQLKIVADPWFDKANKLRFLQANKFKIQETCKSIKQATIWRQKYFPLKKNPKVDEKLNEGTMYFCGRDRQYRPILVAQVVRMKDYSQQLIHGVLNTLLQYAIDNLLIPGQVQNYVLMINLDDAGLSDRGSVSKIVSFTSNTYRSRLYASYLLNTPYLIASGWNAFASSIVSENTLRKIKISRKMFHEDMWTHIDKQIVQEKYGGNLKNLKAPFWPLNEKNMRYCSQTAATKHQVTKQQYNRMFKSGKLKNRKVKAEILDKQAQATPKKIKQDNHVHHVHHATGSQIQSKKEKDSHRTPFLSTPSTGRKMNLQILLPPQKIKSEITVPLKKRDFKLFFEQQKFIYLFQNLK